MCTLKLVNSSLHVGLKTSCFEIEELKGYFFHFHLYNNMVCIDENSRRNVFEKNVVNRFLLLS